MWSNSQSKHMRLIVELEGKLTVSLHFLTLSRLFIYLLSKNRRYFLCITCFISFLHFRMVIFVGVGKSCLLLRFSDGSFTTSFITTIGFVSWTVPHSSGATT